MVVGVVQVNKSHSLIGRTEGVCGRREVIEHNKTNLV